MDDFKIILEEVGILLSFSGEQNILQQPQSMVINKLDKLFKDGENCEENKIKFMDGLKILFECDELGESVYMQCVYKKIVEDEGGNITQNVIKQDSLVKLLLNTELQTQIIEIILNNIADTVINDEENIRKLNMLLNSLRYLSFLLEPDILSTKLLEILQIAPVLMQYEILYAIPEILPDKANEVAATDLSKLLSSNTDITGALIECLNALNLSKSIRREVQEQIVNEVLTSRNIDLFPILYEFLITDCNLESIQYILLKIRTVLNNIFSNTAQDIDKESIKVIIIGKIKNSSAIFKEIFNGWLMVISNVNADRDHKPIDLLLLFILRSISANKKQLIDNLFKKRIKSKLFKLSLVRTCLKDYFNTEILQECLTSIVEIGNVLLKNKKEHLLTEFATEMYKYAFLNKASTFVQRQIILQNLILQTGLYDQENISPVLNVFTQLLEDKTILKQHHLKLLELLEKLDMFDLRDVRTVFDILCSVIYYERDDESMSSIQNELHILIRKHVTCSKNFLKHRGIVCSIVLAKHIATTEEDDRSEIEFDSESILDISRLPSTAAKEGAKLLQLAYSATCNLPILKALYYDELSSMLTSASDMDKYFLSWLFETITQHFQDVFVTEAVENNSIDGINLTSQFCINATEEMEANININVAGLTMSTTCTESNPIIVLAPIFRLLRLLHHIQHDGNLTSIDALLGCGIIMPHIEILDNFSTSQVNKIADCVFHCINWFREIISAFTSQKLKAIRRKVLKRLNDLIELENLLNECVEYSPGHKLPDSYFNNVVAQSNKLGSPKKIEAIRPRKRQKLNETEPNTTIVSIVATPAQIASSNKKGKINIKFVEFREIDIDTIKLLKYPIGGSTIEETPSTQQTNLNLKQFNFLVNDFTRKLYTCLKGKSASFSNVYMVEPKKLITDCCKLLPTIGKQLKTIVNSLNMIQDECEGLNAAELFSEEAKELKIGFKTIMEMFSLVYSWSGFQQNDNYDLLVTCLKSSIDNYSTPDDLISVNALVRIFLKKLADYEKNCLQLQTAVFLIETMKELYCTCSMTPEYKKIIEEVSENMLKRRWYNTSSNIDTGKHAFVQLDIIIGTYFENRTIKFIAKFTTELEGDVSKLQTKSDYLKMLPSVDKANFHVLYKGICHALQERLKVEIQSLANNQHLTLWKTTTKTLEQLIAIVKIKESRGNFLSFFKKAHGILKIFLNKGIPILQIMLKSNPNEVISILKSIQITTRFLHNLCCHSKLTKDSTLIRFVPYCKCTLETIIYRVKAALIANGCTSSFWMGNLKNKDLYGDIIASQTTSTSELTEDTEEMLPEDDEELFMDEDDTANQEI